MSDECTRAQAARRLDPAVSRRAVLGGGLAFSALAAGTDLAHADVRKAAGKRNVRLHRFDNAADFSRGKANGNVVVADTLALADGKTTGHWTSETIRPGFGVTEIIASWNADTPAGSWVEIEVSGRTSSGRSTGWFVLGRWCADNPEQGGAIKRSSVDGQERDIATVYTDTLSVADGQALETYVLRVTLRRKQGAPTPRVSLVSGMASALPADETVPTSPVGAGRGIVLDVPPLSQEVHVGHYPEWDNGGEAWCSPTSVAMVADFWKSGPSEEDRAWVDIPPDEQVDHAARQTFDHTYSGCGNWPFNAAYAATLGLRGFITRLRSLAEAEAFIAAGIPLVTSVSFKKEELDGAGYSTNGHLMVLVGFDDKGNPVMNDPASHLIPDNDEVRVTYKRNQFENVWVPHSGGVVYVIHPASTPLPPALSQPNW